MRKEIEMKYRIAYHISLIDFEDIVNGMIKDGWKPIGGIAYKCDESGHGYYCQAMIKEK